MLDEILARLNNMTPEQRAETEKLALAATRSMTFVPQPGPQTEAYLSKADVLLFGGCVSGETEFLTPVGWKRIDDYRAGDRVAQWDNGKLTFVYPEGYTRAPCDTMLHFRHKRLSMVVTPDHRMPLYDYRGVLVVKTGDEVRRAPSRHTVPVNFTVDQPGLPFSDLLLRLAVAIHADGNLYLKKDGTAHCRISLRKERKKDRLLWLLTELDIPWKEYHNPARPTEVRYSFTSDVTTKTYSGMWWAANQRQLAIILEEMSYWDGDFTGAQGGDIVFNSNHQTDIDFLQYAAHACGRVANYKQRSGGHKRLYITREGSPKTVVTLRQDAVQIAEVERGMKYCFTVPSTFWLARHDGKVFVTGNSPGGGKTGLQIGLALNEHHRSLIVRREFVDLDGVLHTLANILKGDTTGLVGGSRPEYRKKDGGVIHFQGMGKDIGGKQGNPHDLICVGTGTKVLYADGTYKAVQHVRAGDLIQTLEGPKRVQNTFGPFYKPAVLASTERGAQVQSTVHDLLTPAGWLCYETSLPKESRSGRKSSEPSWQTCAQSSPPRAPRFWGPLLKILGVPAFQGEGLKGWLVSAVRTGRQGRENASAAYGGKRLPKGRLLLSSTSLPRLSLLPRVLVSAFGIFLDYASRHGVSGALETSSLPDWRGGCSAGSRPCGERTPESSRQSAAPKVFPLYLHQPSGAEEPTPRNSTLGVTGETPIYTPHILRYEHPYTGETRQACEPVVCSSVTFREIGVQELYDLQVEDVNHYITEHGFINRNCIDEAAQLPEDMVRMLIGWLRTDRPNQRCRVVMGSNPPLDAVGDWLIGYFAPWLDPTHPNPAKEGELRYFLPKQDGSGDRECGADEFMIMDGVRLAPQSRTFISSKYTDNKFYREEDYVKSLAGLPPSVRDRLMSGNFLLTRPDDEFQVIPTDWVRKAQNRWTPAPPDGVPQCAIGVDVAQGGKDRTVLAIRHDGWYAPLKMYPGVETPDGTTAAGVVISHRRNTSLVIVDIGGGWGGDCYAHLKANDIECRSFMGVKQSERRTRDNLLRFFNVRAEAYWRFREALDPAQDGGSRIALPHDPELLADLTTPRFEVTSSGIKITPKDNVVETLGRSPDKGDAVVMAWWDGLRQDNVAGGFQSMRKQVPKVVMGHAPVRRRR